MSRRSELVKRIKDAESLGFREVARELRDDLRALDKAQLTRIALECEDGWLRAEREGRRQHDSGL